MGKGHAEITELKQLKRERREQAPDPEMELDLMRAAEERPRFRFQCRGGERPCPFTTCRLHLRFDVSPAGALQDNFPGVELEDMEQTCALDVADRGGHTLDEVARILGVTAFRVRQLEVCAIQKLRKLRGELTRKVD